MKCGECIHFRTQKILSDGLCEYPFCGAYDDYLKNFPTTFLSSIKNQWGNISKIIVHKDFCCDDCKLKQSVIKSPDAVPESIADILKGMI